MGHGDELVIGDANFPAAASLAVSSGPMGMAVELLDAILKFFLLINDNIR